MFSVVHAAGTSANEVVKLDNPLGTSVGSTDLRVILGRMVNKVLGVLGALALLVFVVGGAMWLTSGGNAEKVKNGSMAMLWAIIGLFIIFSSYAILNLVIKGLFVADTGTSTSVPVKGWCLTLDKQCVETESSKCQGAMFVSGSECQAQLKGDSGKCYCKLLDDLDALQQVSLPELISGIKDKAICLSSNGLYNSNVSKYLEDCKWAE